MVGLTNAAEGVGRAEQQFNAAAERIARMPLSTPGPGDRVELSAAAAALLESKNNFEANTRMAKVIGDFEQASIDGLS